MSAIVLAAIPAVLIGIYVATTTTKDIRSRRSPPDDMRFPSIPLPLGQAVELCSRLGKNLNIYSHRPILRLSRRQITPAPPALSAP
ncbi:MAG: hypothetical protein ACR2OE_00375 [Thermomicrobiales bacterium]